MERRNLSLVYFYDRSGNLPGSGLTVEISPLSFPNCNVVLRGRMLQWKRPVVCSDTTFYFLKLSNFIHPAGSTIYRRIQH